MTNSLQNEYANLHVICPYCKSKHIIQFPIVDLFIYTNLDTTLQTITLKKTLSKKPENEEYIKTLIINSIKRKPFMGRIIITKPYHDAIKELINKGYLSNKELENINGF